jgi:peptide alpha-N-acetyltransferase
MTKPVVLPSKESTLFKNALKFYENKAYKKGLKTTDQILKKFPEHGESLAMKGLFCSHLPDRKGEAHDLIKKGIRADLTSHICWHVLGLYHRADRNYEEALKCYCQALKYDPTNAQISRDVAHMQIHTRNIQAFIETRLDILDARPNIKGNWISLALAYHLNGDYQLAIDVLSSLQDNFKDEYNQKNFENSEFFLYKNWIMEALGKYDEALEDLEKIRNYVVDSTAWLEAKGIFT